MRLRRFFTVLFMLSMTNSWADVDIDQQNISSEDIYKPTKRTPSYFNTHIDVVGTADISKGFYKGDKVHYAEAEVEAGRTIYYCPLYQEGLNVALGFSATYLKWTGNPWFDQDHFNLLSPSIAGFSERMNDWFWRAQFTMNLDTKEWSAAYTSYDITLWGRYAYLNNLGLHFGFLAQTGLYMDRIYPIIGLDWQISRKWKLSLVYPVNVSLFYSITPNWAFAVAGRFLNSRFRVQKDQCFAKSLVRYTNIGVELAVHYLTPVASANIHVGATCAGKYRIADRKNQHAHTYNLNFSPYVGVEMDVKF